MLVTLTEWDKKLFAKPHGRNTLRKWAREGKIQPRPILVGREYQVEEDAKYVQPNNSRLQRLRQAATMQNDTPLDDIDPRVLEILSHGSCTA